MRLDKFISNFTGLTRKESKLAIKQGEVIVNGQVITRSNHALTDTAQNDVRLNGLRVVPQTEQYFMLNKPAGVVCTHHDPTHPSVFALLPLVAPEDFHVAGRLDVDTTGLVLVTNDGQWSHRLTSPRHKKEKVYQVTLEKPLDEGVITQFKSGMQLKNELKRTQPAELIIIDSHQAELRLLEGKYHQVKRMFVAAGNQVTALHRSQIGDIRLDPELAPGESRPLTEAEINSVVGL